jgi:hypothetical protein
MLMGGLDEVFTTRAELLSYLEEHTSDFLG